MNPLSDRNMPRFEHDCDTCTFLGQQGYADVYYCSQGGNLPTVVLRQGDDGPDYYSGWYLVERLPKSMAARARELAGRTEE